MPAAPKNASATNASTGTRKPPAEEPDLLSDLKDDGPAPVASDDNESFDLLDGLTEDEGVPWKPNADEDASPEGIQGRVTYRGEVPSDYGPEMCPHITLEASDGTVWSVRGYGTVLRNQINKVDPQVGDLVAIRYFGKKDGRNGRAYENYKVAVKRAN
jgi:hypothetical protein